MSRPMKRIVLWIVIPLILFLALLITLYVLTNRVINQESVKNSIEAAISEKLHGQFSYERMGLSILPRPRVVIQGPNISIPESLSGRMRSLDIYPELWPLITGKLRFAKVLLDRPDFHFSLLRKTGDQNRLETLPETSPERNLANVLGFVASRMPDLSIIIKQGRITFNQGEQHLFSVQEVKSQIAFLPEKHRSNEPPVVSSEEGFRMVGSIQGVMIKGEGPAVSVRIAVKRFEVSPQTISISDTRIQILDTLLSVSGRLDDYLIPTQKASLTIGGTVGSDTIQWIRTMASLPPELTINAPVTLSQTHLFWNRNGTTRLEGEAAMQGHLRLSFDVSWEPDHWVVKDLSIRDRESQATLAWSFNKMALKLAFIGTLSHSTLNRLFEHERFQFGWLRGDFSTQVNLDKPSEFSARGVLEGEQLVFPFHLNVPITLDRISLRATDRTVTLDPVVVVLGTKPHTVRGQITAPADEWFLNLTTDGLEWEPLSELFASVTTTSREASTTANEKPASFRGTIRVSAPSFTIGRWTAAPARAEITVGPNPTRIRLHEAVVCGVNLPGVITITPSETRIDVKPSADRQSLETTLSCMGVENRHITGTFDLSGHLSATGVGQTLLDTLQGAVAATAKDGRMFQDSIVVRILTYLNVTDLLRGNYPDPGLDGVPYTSLVVRGTLKKGTMSLDEAVLMSPVVNLGGGGSINVSDKTLDLTVLVAPFTTIDAIVKRIPLIKDILAGSIVTIPIRVAGSFQNPEVKGIPPGAVAKGTVDIMKRTLQVPFKILEPIIPGNKGSFNENGPRNGD